MKTLDKKLLILFVCILSIFACLCGGLVFGLRPQETKGDDTAVVGALTTQERNTTWKYIEKHIVIDEHKVCNITEYLTVSYEVPFLNVGIVRQVSRVNKITRIVNNKEYVTKTIAKLDNLTAEVKFEDGEFENEWCEIENEGDFYYLNIGELGHGKDSGTYTFKLNYSIDFGEDFIKGFDDFTFDLMDYDYIQTVGGFSATVTLPKVFLGEGQSIDDVLSFRMKDKVAVDNRGVKAEFNEETLTISCEYPFATVPPENGLTMQLILPNGYFHTAYTPNGMYYFVLIASIIAVVGIVVIILYSRKGQKVVVTTEFYPPDGYSPIDVAKVYRGYVKSKDFASLFLYWASQGYVEIQPNGTNNFIVKKLKDMPAPRAGEDNYSGKVKEKAYFDSLYKNSDIYDTKYAYTEHDSKITTAVNKLYEVKNHSSKKSKICKLLIQFLAILPMFLFIIWNILMDSSLLVLFFIFLFPLIGLMVFVHLRMGLGMLWFKIIWCGGFGVVPFFFMRDMLFLTYDVYHLFWILVAIMVLGSFAVKLVKIHPPQFNNVRGKVLGFKKFLVKVEVDKLERMIYDDPNYYLNILPFCYVFGITKVMEKKFASLRVTLPEYCNGVSTTVFISCISHTHIISHAGRSFSSGGSHGGFSGGGGGHGGSSGGGGGGGGGRGR